MSQCIKCGREIPNGELFCGECSLNPSVRLLNETQERPSAPKTRMQTPQPVRRAPVQAPPPPEYYRPKRKRSSGLTTALIIVSLLLVVSIAFMVLQYSNIQVEKTRLRTKEADLALRLDELDELQAQVEELNGQLEQANRDIEAKEQEILSLTKQLTTSMSSQSQGEYDLTAKQQELDRLTSENQELLAMADELELEIDELEDQIEEMLKALEAAKVYQEKADFMDSFVVFVVNGESNDYHTYDCPKFSKKGFFAYNRSLAEARGHTPCPTCGGGN